MNPITIKNKTDVFLYVLRQTSGFGLAIGFFAFVQAIGIAFFFSKIFYIKVGTIIGSVFGAEHTIYIWGLAILLGLMAGIVIELGSFFFAINAMSKSSVVSAIASGFLSIASYHALLLDSNTDYILIAGVLLLGAYPAIFVGLASHELAVKMNQENTDHKVEQLLAKQPEPVKKPITATNDIDNILHNIGIN